MARLILDTCVLIAGARGRVDLAALTDTDDVAEHHAALLAHTHRTGNRRGAHDLIIAATARASSRTVATTDERARFGELPDVTVRLITT